MNRIGKLPVDPAEKPEKIHARSVAYSSVTLGITTNIDLWRVVGFEMQPVVFCNETAVCGWEYANHLGMGLFIKNH